MEKISQRPGESLVAKRYKETVDQSSQTDLNRLIGSRFKHAMADEETRNHFLWILQRAQQFEDARQSFK